MDSAQKLWDAVEQHRERLGELETAIAVINTKLNLIIAVMSAIGVAIAGVLVKLIFNA